EEIARLAPRSTSLISEPATSRPLLVSRATVAWAAVVLLLCLGLTVWAPLTMRALFARGGLHLSVLRHGSMLELHWNRHQPDLSRATSAILIIQDGVVERRLVLAPAQIREGRIAYRPAGDR